MKKIFILMSLCSVLTSASVTYANDGSPEFQQCVSDLKIKAQQAGISQATIDSSFATVSYTQRVIDLDRQQPEFTTTFADYINRRVTDDRINKGQALLKKHHQVLQEVSQEFGIPPQYLVAFWGLETNYGSFLGKMPVLNSLTTLACDQRRSQFFTEELINALKVIDEGIIKAPLMEGSWAGAMGHVQFMPSAYLRYAIDKDGDGKRDLWNSIPDAMASAANFLKNLGWEKGSRWGREITLPANFPFLSAGLNQTKTLSEWRELGVKQANGELLPDDPMQASLIVPSGHQGPAFLVYDNFRVIMRWNRSEYYALSVGMLADRINGAAPLVVAPPTDAPRLSRAQVISMQEHLAKAGIDIGEADGIFGPATRKALGEFQSKNNRIADGFADIETLKLLGVSL